MSKPRLKLDFTDFNGINKVDHWFTRIMGRDFDIEISDRPDLLIFQDGGHLNRLYTCKKLFWTGESLMPDWSRTDYAMTCHCIDDPKHLRFPYYVWGSASTAQDLTKQPGEADRIIGTRDKFCSAVISNANPRHTSERIDFFKNSMPSKPSAPAAAS